MKAWPLDVGIAVAGTLFVWLLFHVLFPSNPLGLAETTFVLVVLYLVTKGVKLALAKLRRGPDRGERADG